MASNEAREYVNALGILDDYFTRAALRDAFDAGAQSRDAEVERLTQVNANLRSNVEHAMQANERLQTSFREEHDLVEVLQQREIDAAQKDWAEKKRAHPQGVSVTLEHPVAQCPFPGCDITTVHNLKEHPDGYHWAAEHDLWDEQSFVAGPGYRVHPNLDSLVRKVACPACLSKPDYYCTAPTNTGRRDVAWVHLSRELALIEVQRRERLKAAGTP